MTQSANLRKGVRAWSRLILPCCVSLLRTRYLLVLSALFLAASLPTGFAADSLSSFEQTLFLHTYESEPLSQRLNRLETSVFGAQQSGSESLRQARLEKALAGMKTTPLPDNTPSAAGIETVPATGQSSASFFNQTAATSSDSPTTLQSPAEGRGTMDSVSLPAAFMQPALPPESHDATDYPKITAVERQVFGRDFVREDIHYRLDRLERKTFATTSPNLDLVDRVDRLLARYPSANSRFGVMPDSGDGQDVSSAIRSLPSDSSRFISQSRDVYTKMEALEKYFFSGRTFPNELLSERLDRLEKTAYNHSYNGESVDSRVQRLLRGFEVKMAVDPNGQVARPAFQSPPGFAPAPAIGNAALRPSGTTDGLNGVNPTAPASLNGLGSTTSINTSTTLGGTTLGGSNVSSRQNISIGSSFGENSQYHFSDDMMNMLPPSVRSQLSGGSGSTGTVVQAPSTVIIQEDRIAPGFQAYGGVPIRYNNYYGLPGVPTQTQTQTTVIQPDGSASVYNYTTPTLPQTAMLPTPYYTGNPAFLQSLNTLEINVYGRVNTVEPVYVRLGRLESTLLGQMYPSYPESTRLTNLQKTYQLQSLSRLLPGGKQR